MIYGCSGCVVKEDKPIVIYGGAAAYTCDQLQYTTMTVWKQQQLPSQQQNREMGMIDVDQ